MLHAHKIMNVYHLILYHMITCSIALTKSQQGNPPVMVFVGVPPIAKKEMGMGVDGGAKRPMASCTWHRSEYLWKRLHDLKGTPADPKSFRPVRLLNELSELQIIRNKSK